MCGHLFPNITTMAHPLPRRQHLFAQRRVAATQNPQVTNSVVTRIPFVMYTMYRINMPINMLYETFIEGFIDLSCC